MLFLEAEFFINNLVSYIVYLPNLGSFFGHLNSSDKSTIVPFHLFPSCSLKVLGFGLSLLQYIIVQGNPKLYNFSVE